MAPPSAAATRSKTVTLVAVNLPANGTPSCPPAPPERFGLMTLSGSDAAARHTTSTHGASRRGIAAEPVVGDEAAGDHDNRPECERQRGGNSCRAWRPDRVVPFLHAGIHRC